MAHVGEELRLRLAGGLRLFLGEHQRSLLGAPFGDVLADAVDPHFAVVQAHGAGLQRKPAHSTPAVVDTEFEVHRLERAFHAPSHLEEFAVLFEDAGIAACRIVVNLLRRHAPDMLGGRIDVEVSRAVRIGDEHLVLHRVGEQTESAHRCLERLSRGDAFGDVEFDRHELFDLSVGAPDRLDLDVQPDFGAVLAIVEHFGLERLAGREFRAHGGDAGRIGGRALEQGARLAPAGFFERVAGDAGKSMVDPVDPPLRVGDDHRVAGAIDHHRQFTGLALARLQFALVAFLALARFLDPRGVRGDVLRHGGEGVAQGADFTAAAPTSGGAVAAGQCIGLVAQCAQGPGQCQRDDAAEADQDKQQGRGKLPRLARDSGPGGDMAAVFLLDDEDDFLAQNLDRRVVDMARRRFVVNRRWRLRRQRVGDELAGDQRCIGLRHRRGPDPRGRGERDPRASERRQAPRQPVVPARCRADHGLRAAIGHQRRRSADPDAAAVARNRHRAGAAHNAVAAHGIDRVDPRGRAHRGNESGRCGRGLVRVMDQGIAQRLVVGEGVDHRGQARRFRAQHLGDDARRGRGLARGIDVENLFESTIGQPVAEAGRNQRDYDQQADRLDRQGQSADGA